MYSKTLTQNKISLDWILVICFVVSYCYKKIKKTSGVANSIIGGAHIHIFVFTDHENNRFQTKLTVQNMNI